jgi:GlcNAc-P-P-Und epimerase
VKQSKIIVMGGSGFIGTLLVKNLLKSGHTVRILDKEKSSTYPELTVICDVRNKEELTKACSGYDVIYNLAAEHKDNVSPVSLYTEVNVGGAKNTCHAADNCGIRKIIFTSTVAVYGIPKKEVNEESELKPFNEYGKSKSEAEDIYKAWADNNKSLVIVRPTVVFGEGNRGNVYNLLNQIVSGKFLFIGNGKNYKSMAYVENVALFLGYVLKFNSGTHIYNYIDKPDLDMNTFVAFTKKKLGRNEKIGFRVPYFIGYLGGLFFDFVSFLTGKKLPISSIRIKKFCSSTVFSADKMYSNGFTPKYTLIQGIDKFLKSDFNEFTK